MSGVVHQRDSRGTTLSFTMTPDIHLDGGGGGGGAEQEEIALNC